MVGSRLGSTAQNSLWSFDSNGDLSLLTGSEVTSPLFLDRTRAYFSARDTAHGNELWFSDATPNGTSIVADIYPGPNSSNPTQGGPSPSNFLAANGRLFFAANHPDHDVELWALELSENPPPPEPPLCDSADQALCLNDRFRITIDWADHEGLVGQGQAVELVADTGAFWFFNPANLELLVKIIDACSSTSNSYWFFAGGLTDVAVSLRVEDLETGEAREYSNPIGQAFVPIQDTRAFLTCPPTP